MRLVGFDCCLGLPAPLCRRWVVGEACDASGWACGEVEELRARLSPAIPRLPLGGEPLGLGDLRRGHLIGDAVSREPRPAAVR